MEYGQREIWMWARQFGFRVLAAVTYGAPDGQRLVQLPGESPGLLVVHGMRPADDRCHSQRDLVGKRGGAAEVENSEAGRMADAGDLRAQGLVRDAEVSALLSEVDSAEGAVCRDVQDRRAVCVQGGADLGESDRCHLGQSHVTRGDGLPDARGLGAEVVASGAWIAGDEQHARGGAR